MACLCAQTTLKSWFVRNKKSVDVNVSVKHAQRRKEDLAEKASARILCAGCIFKVFVYYLSFYTSFGCLCYVSSNRPFCFYLNTLNLKIFCFLNGIFSFLKVNSKGYIMYVHNIVIVTSYFFLLLLFKFYYL